MDMYKDAIHYTWIYLILTTLPLFVFGSLLAVLGLIGIFKKLMKKYAAVLCLILGSIVVTFAVAEISVFSYDIHNANFEVYYGEFDYKNITGKDDVFKFHDEHGLYIRGAADLGIDSGVHCGYILYCKISRWAIAYSEQPFE